MRLTRTTLLLLAANLACAVAVWRSLPDTEAAAVHGLAFPIAPAWIEVEGSAGKLRLERSEGGWSVTHPFRWSANRWEVQRLLGELALAREAPRGATRPAAGERWTVRAGAEGGPAVEAQVLADAARGALLDGGERGKALAGEALVRALAQPAEAYRVDAVFSLAPYEVRALGVRVSRPGAEDRRWGLVLEARETVGRQEQGAVWRFEAPDNVAADAERLPRALAALAELRVTRFLPPRAAPAADKPWLRLSLEAASRRETLLVWPARDGQCEAALEDNPNQPFLIAADALKAWADPLAELRTRSPFDFDPALARGLTLRHLASGRSLTLHRLEGAEGRWEIPVVAGSTATRRLEVGVGRARQFLRLLTDLRSDGSETTAPQADWHRLAVEFPGGSLTRELALDPAGGRLLVRAPGEAATACPTDLPLARWLSVETGAWRSEILTRLPVGTRVAKIELRDAAGKSVAKADLADDGRWLAEGEIDAAAAARLAERLGVVQALAFPTDAAAKDAAGWPLTLLVTDRSAAGASGSTETVRTYRLGRQAAPGAPRMRDETEGVVFVPEPGLAEALAPWTTP